MAKCGACGRFISQADTAKCRKCIAVYHRVCVNLPAVGTIPSSWLCPECTKNVVRDNKADTPIKPQVQHSPSLTETGGHDRGCSECELTPVHQVRDEFICNLRLLSEELCAVRSELQLFREDMADLRSSLMKCNKRMDGLEERLNTLEQQKAQPASDTPITDVLAELRQELNERDQELLANDVEFGNLPESNGENPLHLVGQIAMKLGVVIDERDIVTAERVGAYHIGATSGDGPERRPRPLVVRLTRRHLRDELLQAARVRRGSTTEGVCPAASPRRFYVNERLTKHNRHLFRKTREAGRLCGWKFIWTKRGSILARKEPGDPYFTVRTEADLPRIFGANSEKKL